MRQAKAVRRALSAAAIAGKLVVMLLIQAFGALLEGYFNG
jgi:hypothetical protein